MKKVKQKFHIKKGYLDLHGHQNSQSGNIVVSQLNEIKEYENFKWVYNHKVHYLNIPCAFDIETSSFKEGIAKKAIMYLWSLNINGVTFLGRTWSEFTDLIKTISEVFELNKFNRRLLIYIHNLEYEFQFMRKWFNWYSIFADDKRSPIYCVTDSGIEFRCSYRLSGYSLAKLGEELSKYKITKAVGDLDYSLLRHSETPLTPAEIDYSVRDVGVVVCYIQEELEKEGDISKLPYTKTGYVRRFCMQQCLKYDDEVSRLKALKYGDIMRSLTLTTDDYIMCKRGFQGGFTHASVRHVNETLYNVTSIDFTSSYPFTMMAQYFPMSSAMDVEVHDLNTFLHYIRSYCCLFEIEFINIRASTLVENTISISRCLQIENPVVNNGRIVTATKLQTVITELDFDIINNFYKWDSIKIGKFKIFYRGYLPTSFVKSLVKLYKDKTELKGVAGKEVEYLLSKGMLNSAYGMAVTDIVRNELEYSNETPNDGWTSVADTDVSQLKRYNNNYSRFLYYPWGVWVTAHARHNLFEGIKEFGDDYIYADTDSIKCINYEKHKDFINKYNNKVRRLLEDAADFHNIPMEDFEPMTIKGEKKLIGVWDYEGTYDKFKTLGAKRYVNQKGDKIEFTVAGVKKQAILDYMVKTYGKDNVFEHFTRNLYIPPESTGKLTHTYIDREWEGYIIDYTGKIGHYYEKSAIHLEPAGYSFSMIDAFWEYVKGVKQIEK